jgi:hypothetical protein
VLTSWGTLTHRGMRPSTAPSLACGLVATTALLVAFAAPARAAAAGSPAECPAGNLLSPARLTGWLDTEHPAALLTDGVVVPEGAYFASQAVLFESNAASLTYDLGAAFSIHSALLQADAGASFSLQGSVDGRSWRPYRIAPVPDAQGMRTRRLEVGDLVARFVRIGEPTGDGPHAITELQVFCEPEADPSKALRVVSVDAAPDPDAFPLTSRERAWLAFTGAPWLTESSANAAKLALCLAAIALLVFGALVDRARRALEPPVPPPWHSRAFVPAAVLAMTPLALVSVALTCAHGVRGAWSIAALVFGVVDVAALAECLRRGRRGTFRDAWFAKFRFGLLGAIALVSYLGYYNWGSYLFPDYVHQHDSFHYFVGAKYFRELGYTRFYECASLADAEEGLTRRVELGTIRDLSTNDVVDGRGVLQGAQECRELFSPTRWAAFKLDVSYFRDHMSIDDWSHALRDHGYNPTPLWTTVGSALFNLRPASRTFIGYGDSMFHGVLALFDPVLLLVALGVIAWAFGWRRAFVAAIFLGCTPLARYSWTGGSLLRQDWLFATVLGLAMLEKGRPAIGGASLAYATLVRVFPGVFFVPIALHALFEFRTQRRVGRAARRVLAGAALAVVALVPLSGWGSGRGLGAWAEFERNSAKHAATPTANLVGLPPLLSYRPSTRAELLFDPALPDPFAPAVLARKRNLSEVRPLQVALVVAFLLLLMRATRRAAQVAEAAPLGAALIPIVSGLSCYYSSYLTPLALLQDESGARGVALLLSTAALCVVQALTSQEDVRCAWASLVLVLFAVWTAWRSARGPRAPVVPEGAS